MPEAFVSSANLATADLIEECAAFPNGKHDDQVDAMTQALLRRHMIPQEIVIQFSQPYQISPY
jgi:phage terminase large subunit-like protein